jgi:hypothetical protein
MSQHDSQKREVRLAPDPKIDFVEGLRFAPGSACPQYNAAGDGLLPN